MGRSESLRNQRGRLNFVGVLRQLFPKHAGKIGIVQNYHVSVVLFVIIVLPTFVPPTEANNRGPAIGKKVFERISCPLHDIDMPIVQLTTELCDDHWFSRRELGQTRVSFVNFESE